MLQNLVNYMKLEAEEHASMHSELHSLKYRKHRTYSARVIRYALQLRYTSLQTYNLLLEELSLPSVSYLRSLTNGELQAVSFSVYNES